RAPRRGPAQGRTRRDRERPGPTPAVRVKIMLDRTHVGVAQRIAFGDQRERVLPVRLGRLLARADVGEELDSKLHHATEPAAGESLPITLSKRLAAAGDVREPTSDP